MAHHQFLLFLKILIIEEKKNAISYSELYNHYERQIYSISVSYSQSNDLQSLNKIKLRRKCTLIEATWIDVTNQIIL